MICLETLIMIPASKRPGANDDEICPEPNYSGHLLLLLPLVLLLNLLLLLLLLSGHPYLRFAVYFLS